MAYFKVHDKKLDKDISLYYHTVGNKDDQPIIMIHGWLCNSKFWEEFLDIADLGYFLIIPELRGHGNSEYSKDTKIDVLAEDIHALFEELDISRAIILGHSMGGLTAQAFYHKYPEKVVALGLWNTGGQIPLGYGIGTLFYVIRLFFFIIGLLISYPITPLFRFVLSQGWKLAWAKRGKSKPYQKYVVDVKKMNKAAVIRAAFSLSSFKEIDRLKSIDVPTLLLHGAKDSFVTPIQLAEKMNTEIPNSRLVQIDETAHFSPNEDPSKVKEHLKVFLNEINSIK
ncbi:MAG: alpha/beta fold hydrolase [Candidatus Lokiarchaeota archaeon]|nr:alpha/beta fold hydrolase [Candidatus Lokiarchaeota archaeon]